MSEVIKIMVLIVLFSGLTTLQYNMDADETTTRQLKNSLELAVHDAALALDESQLSNGEIVFDQDQAIEQFKSSLENNLQLQSGEGYLYTPTENSFYKHDFYLEHLEFLDDSNSTFPLVYENSDYDILDKINGPSIVAVVSTTSPRYFAGNGITARKAVVYEYTQ
ncbi:peptidase M23 [Halobacillus litoralis]|uniref:Peptidase M23 n=1 Tax=Halobacillus litoralis TaxID=45668 RepID=A0A410MJJ2_9BACI|nr:peptidase M23 [Halobacillus litoralis]QAS54825.1 peptidase M23 [Halobacillus litoralis]